VTEDAELDLPAVIRDRREKLERLRAAGVEPYARGFKPTHSSAQAKALLGDGDRTDPIALAGRLMVKRLHGGSAFADLQDGAGRIQLMASREILGAKAFELFADLDPGDAPEGAEVHLHPEDDAWVEGRSLVATVEDLELIDPAISSERLVYRLFHERGVRVFKNADVRSECSCSRASVTSMLRSFPQDDRDHMVEQGVISVTCEFCNTTYAFDPGEVADGEPTIN